jgi:acetoin utilization deacetylase AcuC-like enzyme
MKVGIVYDPVFLKHNTGEHLESPCRLKSTISRLGETKLLDRLVAVSPCAATEADLTLIHYPQYIHKIKQIAESGGGELDSETIISADSYEAAIYAVGGTIRAVDAVMDGQVDQAFALVRPPGHHATPGQGMGFCLFNNIAIAAKHLLTRRKVERLAIIDFDVHHGNGTQTAFYSDPRVLYASLHQYPLYPGTGHMAETGVGEAAGTKVNIPLPAGCGDAEYLLAFEKVIVPSIRRFDPQFILVSAGYDSHWLDTISTMQVSIEGFVKMIHTIRSIAREVCNNRLVLVLEGGYNLVALPASIEATFSELLGNEPAVDPLGPSPNCMEVPDIKPLIRQIRDFHAL